MRLHILSDLHLEFSDYAPDNTRADVIVLAGDIDQGTQGIGWVKRHFPKKPVVYVMGNHEFYGHSMLPLMEECQEATKGGNIHILENQSIKIGDITFLGCTLWTDFKLWPKPAEAMEASGDCMNDFKLIRTQSGRLHPRDTVKYHQDSVAWLKSQLKQSNPAKTVIITHHAPSKKSFPARHAGDILNSAFASDLNTLITKCRVPLWVHGHTHHCVDYKIGQTRIYSNQRGYPGEYEVDFDGQATVDIG